jgi:hypothetical protein
MMSNWNHGMAIVNRYAVWIGILVIYHSIQLLCAYGLRIKSSIILVVFAMQCLFIKIHQPYNNFDWCNNEHLPFAKWALMKYPHLYNPDPQIFLLRTSKVFDVSVNNSPVFYTNKANGQTQVLKVAVHEDGLNTLISYGLTLNQIKSIKTNFYPIAHWYYINDLPTLKKINMDHLELNREKKEIDRIKKAIFNNLQWMKDIKKKAKLNNISFEDQVEADARWYLYQQE